MLTLTISSLFLFSFLVQTVALNGGQSLFPFLVLGQQGAARRSLVAKPRRTSISRRQLETNPELLPLSTAFVL